MAPSGAAPTVGPMNLISACALQTRHRDGYKLAGGTGIDSALAGAALVEAVLRGVVRLDDDRLVVVDRTPSGDPLVDEAVTQMATRDGEKAVEVVGALTRNFPRAVDRILKEEGVVSDSWGRFMVVLPYRATRPADPAARDRAHAALVGVLRGEEVPTERQVALLHLLGLADVSPRVFKGEVGDSAVVAAAMRRLEQHAALNWPDLCTALDVVDAASLRLRGSGDAAAASF